VIYGLVTVAAVLGALGRWQVSQLSWRPMGNFVVNVTGAFGLGLIASSVGDERTVLGLAGLGAFTTVSGLVDDAAEMRERGRGAQANAYILSSVVLGIAAAWIGLTVRG
jgi:CrcB protein